MSTKRTPDTSPNHAAMIKTLICKLLRFLAGYRVFEFWKAPALLLFCLLLWQAPLSAQTSAVVDAHWEAFLSDHSKYESSELQAYVTGLPKLKPALKDEELGYALSLVIRWGETLNGPEEQADVYYHCGALWDAYLPRFQPYMASFCYERIIVLGDKYELYDQLATALTALVGFYSRTGEPGKGLLPGRRLEKLLEDVRILPQLTELPIKYTTLGQQYYQLWKFDKAIDYFRKALEEGLSSPNDQLSIMNSLALSYQKSGRLEEAIQAYDRVIYLAKELGDLSWTYIAQGNKGTLLMELGRKEEGEELLLQDFYGNLNTNSVGSSLNAGVYLAQMYLENNDLEKADKFLRMVEGISDTLGVLPKALSLRADYFARTGDWKRAFELKQRVLELRDSVNQEQDFADFYAARESHSLLLQEALWQKSLKDQERATQRRQFYTLAISALLLASLACIGLIVYYRQRQRLREQAYLNHESEKDKKEMEQMLRQMRRQLQLGEDLERQILNAPSKIDKEELQAILSQFTLSTEEDWAQFKKLVDDVHGNFIKRLLVHPINFSPGEVRLLALLKLEFNQREIARILGINADSVKKSRQRLRKKLEAAGDAELMVLLSAG